MSLGKKQLKQNAFKRRARGDPYYHGDYCEVLYHQILGLKLQRAFYVNLLKTDKSKGNRDMFNWLSDQIRIFKLHYEHAYLVSAPLDKRGREQSYQGRVGRLTKQLGIQ